MLTLTLTLTLNLTPNPNPNHHQEPKSEPEQRSEFSLRVESLNPGQLTHAGPLPRSKVMKY